MVFFIKIGFLAVAEPRNNWKWNWYQLSVALKILKLIEKIYEVAFTGIWKNGFVLNFRFVLQPWP